MSAATDAAVAEAAARVREITAAKPPAGLDIAQLAAWYAERFGALAWHAGLLADHVDGALKDGIVGR